MTVKDLLIDSEKVIIHAGSDIEFGRLDASEPDVEKWKLSENLFALDGGYSVVKSVETPDYVMPWKFRYTDGKFTINPEYQEPVSIETLHKQITELQLALAELVEGGIN